MLEGKGPTLPAPIQTENDLKRIHIPDVQETLSYVFDALALTKKELNGRVPLIGFAGAPWKSSATWCRAKAVKLLMKQKHFVTRSLNLRTSCCR